MNGGIWGAAAGLAIFLFFPVFLTANVFADVKARKGYFSFYLMRFIKIYGGYATLYDRGIAFHLTGRKAALLPYGEIVDTGKKFEITCGFYILAYSHVAEIGSRAEPAAALLACAAVQAVSACVAGHVFRAGKCASFKSDALLHAGEDCAKVSLRAVLVFNMAILLLAAVKIALRKILEKAEEYERKKARTKNQ